MISLIGIILLIGIVKKNGIMMIDFALTAERSQGLEPKFDRFYRVDASGHNEQIQGHGLGLAIVKAVATMHGGDVFADSSAGITTIGFSVPTMKTPRPGELPGPG